MPKTPEGQSKPSVEQGEINNEEALEILDRLLAFSDIMDSIRKKMRDLNNSSWGAEPEEKLKIEEKISAIREEANQVALNPDVSRDFHSLIDYIHREFDGEDFMEVLGWLSRLDLSATISGLDKSYRKGMKQYKYFSEVIPDELEKYSVDAILHGDYPLMWQFYYRSEEKIAKIRLKEKFEHNIILEKTREIPMDINQNSLPVFLHGFSLDYLQEVLTEGLMSDRKKREVADLSPRDKMEESAFPMFVSFARPDKILSEYYSGDDSYKACSIYDNYGPGEHTKDNVAAIVDFDYILPRSIQTSGRGWRFHKTHIDEWQSTVDTVPSDKIVGLVCHPDKKDEIIEMLKEQPELEIKLYDIEGNMLYPHEMSKEDVAKEFQERLIDKIK